MTSRVARLVSYKAASDVAGKAAVLALLILCARVLPTREFGLISLATTLGWMASIASDFGLQLYLGRAIARSSTPGQTLWPLFEIRLRAAGGALVAVALLAWTLAPRGTWTAFVLVAAAPVITSVAEFLNYAYRGLGRSEVESGLSLIQRVAALVLVAAGLLVAPHMFTVGLALSASAVGALAASIGIASRLTSTGHGPASPGLTWHVWMHEVAPIGLGLILSALYFRVDVFLLERWSGLDSVAHYSAVFRIVDALRLAPAAVITVVLPRLFGARDPVFARRLALGLTGFAVLVTLVAWPLSTWVVSLAYGPAYTDASHSLQILLLSFPLLTLNYSLTHQLIGWNQPRAYAGCCLAALAANLALNAWLIPTRGALGAAWSTLVTEVVVTAMCVWALHRARTSR